jgi:outer membrane protein TolC
MKIGIYCFGVSFFAVSMCWAQKTEPIQPKTPDIVVPPAIQLPSPAKIEEAIKRPLTADDAVVIAIARQQSVVIARAAVRQARGQRRATESPLVPSLSLNSTYTDLDVIQTASGGSSGSSSTSSGYQTNLALKQLLFDFSHSHDLVRQAEYIELATVFGFRSTVSDLVLQVKQAYYTVVQNQGLVAAAEANVKNRQSQQVLAQGRLDSGLGAPADVISAKTNLADAVNSLTQARLTLSVSRMALAKLMGLDPRTPLELKESNEAGVAVDDLDALVAEALKQRPDVAEAVATRKAAEAGLAAARTNNAPALSFTANLNGKGNDKPFDSQYSTFVVTLSWALFDGGGTRGRIEQAKGSVQSATAAEALVTQSAISDVSTAYLNLKTAEQRMVVTQAAVANALEGVRLAEGRYSGQVAIFVEITTAQAALFSAQSNDATAKAALQQARASLARALGRNIDLKLKP